MIRPVLRPATAALAAVILAAAGGCNSNGGYLTPDRLDNGLVIILPGIEGESELNHNIRRGLIAGGVYRAMPIHSWGRPIPGLGMIVNQMDVLGNRLAAVTVARMVTNYQDSHPGKPVHIVGHSGGGGIAVFAAEALPAGRQVDGLVLLSASISSAYDLTKALSRCRKGIVNFYNRDDGGLLGVGTTIFGNVDGIRGPSAGLLGFDQFGKPGAGKLYQVRLSSYQSGGDPHASTTRVGFVSMHVAPWVLAKSWPTGARVSRRAAAAARTAPPPEPEPACEPPATTRPAEDENAGEDGNADTEDDEEPGEHGAGETVKAAIE